MGFVIFFDKLEQTKSKLGSVYGGYSELSPRQFEGSAAES